MVLKEDILVVIPARGGSKGIPRKNLKLLGNKPLIAYTIEVARELFEDTQICVSTDDEEIAAFARTYGNIVPFMRPADLSTDEASSQEVILHALDFYREKEYKAVILLQPTSPFRKKEHIEACVGMFDSSVDMIATVSESHANPYFNLMEENSEGFLTRSKPSDYTRRQDCPSVYALNGAVYVINTQSVRTKLIAGFDKVRKVMMSSLESVDLDTPLDWKIATLILEESIKTGN
ncbi:MAG: CMP-N-acetylneuraminic acid synthetase [Fluviicola sp.]|jgi:N-acylneuraminate cytidylyltransferase|uniref:acylneuraminate cytidylyltransferase family protein n=1 Tax=Fluviicola sp. TaxID=1917219 RepID=UPI002634CBFE|nr:acylneuraminate cytidylyltransferase family protein [Fluviicola sp.]MDF3027329.1 CMP-N-acetylneuraminic acid synthetase [Fluviicola sp.]